MVVPEDITGLGNKLPRIVVGSEQWERLWVLYLFAGLPISGYFFDILVTIHGPEGALKHLDKLRQEERAFIEQALL